MTKEPLEQADRQIVRSDAMLWLVIGDRPKVEPQLKKVGIPSRVLTLER